MPPIIFLHGTQNSDQRSPYTPAVCRYRQTYPAGDALLKVESFDYLAFSVLQITGLHESELEIKAVHIDHAIPLFAQTQEPQDRNSQPQYPLRLAKDSSISLLLNIFSLPHIRVTSSLPQKVIIAAKQSTIIFEAEL